MTFSRRGFARDPELTIQVLGARQSNVLVAILKASDGPLCTFALQRNSPNANGKPRGGGVVAAVEKRGSRSSPMPSHAIMQGLKSTGIPVSRRHGRSECRRSGQGSISDHHERRAYGPGGRGHPLDLSNAE